MATIIEYFLEARKSKSSSKSTHYHSTTHHNTTCSGVCHHSNLSPKAAAILIGVIVGIIVLVLLIYLFVHHREFKKAQREVFSGFGGPLVSHVEIGKKAALTAITFGLIELGRKKRRGKDESARDEEAYKTVPPVDAQYGNPIQYDGPNSHPYEGQTSGLYGHGEDGKRGFGAGEVHLTADELVEGRREKLMDVDR